MYNLHIMIEAIKLSHYCEGLHIRKSRKGANPREVFLHFPEGFYDFIPIYKFMELLKGEEQIAFLF